MAYRRLSLTLVKRLVFLFQAIALILANPPEGKVFLAPVAAAAAAADVAAPSNDDDKKPAAVDIPQKKPLKTTVKALKVTALKNVLLAASLDIPAKKADIAAAVLAGLDTGTISLQLYYTAIEMPAPVTAPVLNNTSAAKGPQPQCTLIVCPVSVMGNWQAQIEAHVEPGSLKVSVWRGCD
jgi:SNF2-related domain